VPNERKLSKNYKKKFLFIGAGCWSVLALQGWAQINYGYAAGAEQNAIKLEYDLYYIKNRNLLLTFLSCCRLLRHIFGFERKIIFGIPLQRQHP
jgi:lipopolysaccharide/colanic/teichoic acid biosynthesis glycosyltransferase